MRTINEESRIASAYCDITHGYDGPVTPFVAMSRACELSAKGAYAPDMVANALSDALDALNRWGSSESSEY